MKNLVEEQFIYIRCRNVDINEGSRKRKILTHKIGFLRCNNKKCRLEHVENIDIGRSIRMENILIRRMKCDL